MDLARTAMRSLGLGARAAARPRELLRRSPLLAGMGGGAGLALLAALVLALLGDPHGGRARAVLAIGERPVPPADALMSMVEDTGEPRLLAAPGHAAHLPADAPQTEEAAPQETARIAPDGTVTLAAAPDLALVAEGQFGLVPIIASDGRRAAEVYARPVPPPTGRPRIAIVLAGMGLSPSATRKAIASLPGEITFAFAPHGEGLQSWVNRARAAGHEAMLEVPLEPFDYPQNDPGPNTLLAGAPTSDNLRRLDWTLSRFTGYTGLLAQGGPRFTAAEDAMRVVLAAVSARGLLYVEDGASPRSQALRAARASGADAALADRIIDDRLSREAIDLKLLELERVAASRGVAIGLGFAYPATIDQVGAWVPTLRAKGYDLVPVSDATLHRPS
ncbi:MAG: divergent polysaccharide deacetylase family protein [Alphaproteobacteria bacterium]|nr:divergent polysaccharide deacetylase family protein [Alphaproteobacteria bacterium]